jgi:glycosyltransferase involved in cell wall biosynthesis
VIYPPVNTDLFSPPPDLSRSSPQREGDFFLLVSQLVPYKRIDLVVKTFNRCGRPLVIVGDGPERKKLEKQAALNIRFAGSLPQKFVVRAMQQCRAFVFAGEEDFGIVMAEAQACGKPAVAFGRGGAAEIVDHGVTGILFQDQTVESLLNALEEFDRTSFDASAIRLSALRFARPRFLSEFGTFVRDAMNGS